MEKLIKSFISEKQLKEIGLEYQFDGMPSFHFGQKVVYWSNSQCFNGRVVGIHFHFRDLETAEEENPARITIEYTIERTIGHYYTDVQDSVGFDMVFTSRKEMAEYFSLIIVGPK